MDKGKKTFIIALLATSIMVIGGSILLIMHNAREKIEVQQFNVDDYQFFVNNYPSDECLGRISNASDATAKAETMWFKIYGKKEKAYQIFYDEINSVWLIHGSKSSDSFGGVAYIIMDSETGKVLAIWHDK